MIFSYVKSRVYTNNTTIKEKEIFGGYYYAARKIC